MYRWTIQAFGLPFAVAYLCDQVSNRDKGNRWKLELPEIESSLLIDPSKMKTQIWGMSRATWDTTSQSLCLLKG